MSVPGRYVLRARLARMEAQNILFSLPQHAIFDLNDTAADIWESLEEGWPPSAIVAEMAGRGIPEGEARAHVATSLDHWERLGLVHPEPSAAADPSAIGQMLAIAGLRFDIEYPATLGLPVDDVFRHLESRDGRPAIRLRVQENGPRLHLFRGDEWLLSCTTEELPTMLKSHLVAEILDRARYEIALHAAALVHEERVLLLAGSPGAGKTTLTLGLVEAGLRFAGDDVALLDTRGRVTGLPFAPAVKSGAWPVLAARLPRLRSAPVYLRPDGRRVRYPVPADPAPAGAHAVGWLVLLDRTDADARLEAVDPATALRGLLNGAYAATEQLSEAGVDVLIRILGTVPAYRLTYAHLDDAVRLLSGMVDDAGPDRL